MSSQNSLLSSRLDPWRPTIDRLSSLLEQVVAEETGTSEISTFADTWVSWSHGRRQNNAAERPTLPGAYRSRVIRLITERLRLQNLSEDLARMDLVATHRGIQNRLPHGSLDALSERLKSQPPNIAAGHLSGRIVLTVHPTESTRRTILQHMRAISKQLRKGRGLDGVALAHHEESLKEALRVLWRTPNQRANRPRVRDEVELGLFYLKETLVDALSDILVELDRIFTQPPTPTLRWAVDSWIGGDRDGHPFVDAALTEFTLKRHRSVALSLYDAPLANLERTVSTSREYLVNPKRLEAWLGVERPHFDTLAQSLAEQYPEEPLRQMVGLIRAKMAATQQSTGHGYPHAQSFEQDLTYLGLLWDENPQHWPYVLRRLMFQVQTFGFHLATLDIRQHSRIHEQAVVEIIGEDYTSWSESERVIALTQLGEQPLPWVPTTPATQDLRDVLEVVATARRHHGPQTVERFLVSMAHQPSDLLEVWILMRTVDPNLNLAIVPVFETLDDLRRAKEILTILFQFPLWQHYLARQYHTFEVMLGYSDSTKDAGVFTGSWAIYQVQRELLDWGREHGVNIGFFHGRGGALGRGGGPTSRAIMSQPPETAWHSIRITQQGEVLSQKFLLPEMAHRSLELMLTAHVMAALYPGPEIDQETQAFLDPLSDRALAVYRELIQAPEFWDYFLAVTPIREMTALNWGSRPSWREQFQWEDLRAIPWVFAWNQNRMGIPGWFGAGSALEWALNQPGGHQKISSLLTTWPFLSTLLHNLELALVKSDLHMAADYQGLADPSLVHKFWPIVQKEHTRLKQALKEILGGHTLLAKNPRLAHAVAWRNPLVDVLNSQQIDLLACYRQTGDDQWLPLIAHTMEGIALGLRNSG